MRRGESASVSYSTETYISGFSCYPSPPQSIFHERVGPIHSPPAKYTLKLPSSLSPHPFTSLKPGQTPSEFPPHAGPTPAPPQTTLPPPLSSIALPDHSRR